MEIIRNEYGGSMFIALKIKKSDVTDAMFRYVLNCAQASIDELKDDYQYETYIDYLNMQDVVNYEVRADHQLQFIWPEDNTDSLFVGVPVSFEELEPFRPNFDNDDINRVVQFRDVFDLDVKIKNYITCPGE